MRMKEGKFVRCDQIRVFMRYVHRMLDYVFALEFERFVSVFERHVSKHNVSRITR